MVYGPRDAVSILRREHRVAFRKIKETTSRTMTNAFAMVYGLAAFLAPVGGMVADRFGLGVTMAFASIAAGSSFFRVRVGRREHRIRSAF